MYYHLILAWRRNSEFINGALFCFIIVTLFCANVPYEPSDIMPSLSLLWLTTIFASLLDLRNLFTQDHSDGSLDIILLEANNSQLLLYVYIKLVKHTLTNLLPLLLLYPLAGIMLHLPQRIIIISWLVCAISNIAIIFLASLSAAVNILAKPSGLLSFILILPLSTPLFIFATGADYATLHDSVPLIPLLFLIALTLLFAIIGPIGACLLLRYLND